jgi:hypothetical protein
VRANRKTRRIAARGWRIAKAAGESVALRAALSFVHTIALRVRLRTLQDCTKEIFAMREVVLLAGIVVGAYFIAQNYFHLSLFDEQGATPCPLVIDANTGKTTNRNCETSPRSRAP